MPILKNAKKALRSSKRKKEVNSRVKSQLKTAMDTAKKSTTKETITEAYSKIDRAVKSGVIHRNAAARLKSQVGKKKTA
jgi:small subunit ribosomal protein S20